MHKTLCNCKSSVCHLLPGRQRRASDAGIYSAIRSRTFDRRGAIQLWNVPGVRCQPLLLLPSLHTRPSAPELTPQSSTKDLWVKFLLVFTNFRTVTLRADIRWVDVDNGALPCIFSPDGLRFCTRCWNERHMQSWKTWLFGYSSHLTCLWQNERNPRGVRKPLRSVTQPEKKFIHLENSSGIPE